MIEWFSDFLKSFKNICSGILSIFFVFILLKNNLFLDDVELYFISKLDEKINTVSIIENKLLENFTVSEDYKIYSIIAGGLFLLFFFFISNE